MSYGSYNYHPAQAGIYKTSSVNFESRASPSNYTPKLRTNSSMGRTNLAQQGAHIIKDDSKPKLDVFPKEDSKKGMENHYYQESKAPKSSSIVDSKKETRLSDARSSKGVVGFRNLGNTCYMNSILQCLVHLPQFRDMLQNIEKNDMCPTSKLKGKLALAFKDFINEVKSTSNFSAITPYDVKAQIGLLSRQFAGYEQQDSAEFLRCCLEGLNQDLSRVLKKPSYREMTGSSNEDIQIVADRWWEYSLSRDNSLITDFFQGQFASVITCEKCNYGSFSCDCFLSINLPSQDYSYRTTPLEECLDMYFASSKLPSSYKCERCKNTGYCNQKITLFRFPRVMIFQLKRFQVTGFNKQRLNTEISYPEELNLNKYRHAKNTNSPKYTLYGISHHQGSLNFGHYISHCKEDFTWYCFDDSRVYSIETPTRSSTAYLLFYVAGH